jgi:hypothetical protein
MPSSLEKKITVNAYPHIEFDDHQIPLLKVPISQQIDIHLVPDLKGGSLEARRWWNNQFNNSIIFPPTGFPRVHS